MHEDEIKAINAKEEKRAKEISQLQNRQKILLNRKCSEEHRDRTHRSRRAHLYTVSGAVRPAGGYCVLRTRWGLRPSNP